MRRHRGGHHHQEGRHQQIAVQPRAGGVNADKWQSGQKLPPAPEFAHGNHFRGHGGDGDNYFDGAVRMAAGPDIPLHKSENAYRKGQAISADPEDEQAQKDYKALLNKIVPTKFEKFACKLLELVDSRADAQHSLQGFVHQLHFKAMVDEKYSAMYALLMWW